MSRTDEERGVATPEEGGANESPTRVPARANPDGQTPGPEWAWVDPTIWTPRMVQALRSGVKGGVWYTLWDKINTPRALASAFAKVKANGGAPGVDRRTVEAFERDKERHLRELGETLAAGTYRPSAIRRCYIPKGGSKELRPLGIPTVRDRVVQTALRAALEPIYEREFAEHSYGFRPGRSAHHAIDRVERLLCAGNKWVVDLDLKSYFDTVPHAPLMALVRERVADGRVLALVETFLTQPVEDEGRRMVPTVGTPQGAVISPLLANLYLNPLDHHMAGLGFEMTRYADDLVVQCRSEEDARRALAEITRWCGLAALTVHPIKTRIVRVSVTEGFDFLGYHFREHRDDPGRVKMWPREKSVAKLRDTLRPLTRRRNGDSLEWIIRRMTPILRGFFQYFHKSVATPLREIDGWVRERLRAILRTRRKRRGRPTVKDRQRWPNAFFAKLGLFSLVRVPVPVMHSPSG
jgi:RNA-directed DNA polymerase